MADDSSPPSRRALRLVAPAARAVAIALWPFKHRFSVGVQSTLLRYRFAAYGLPGEPYRLRYVPPGAIERMISGSKYGRHNPGHGVVEGEWDRRAYPFESNEIYGLFVDRFVHGMDWEETDGFETLAARIEAGEQIGGLDTDRQTVAQLRAYLDYWDDVYESIEHEGYKSQVALTRGDDFIGRPASITGEISVYVGRNGELICRTGKHRLTIAKIQDIDRVPVRIWVRHAEWHAIREAFANADSLDELDGRARAFVGHPDLEDVSPDRTRTADPREEERAVEPSSVP